MLVTSQQCMHESEVACSAQHTPLDVKTNGTEGLKRVDEVRARSESQMRRKVSKEGGEETTEGGEMY